MRTSPASQILILLKTEGPLTSSQVAARLRSGAEAARQQLVKLAGDGLVRSESETVKGKGKGKGKGRPKQLWCLTARGHETFPDGHAELTLGLIRLVRDRMGEQALDALVAARGQETAIAYQQAMAGAADLATRIEYLAMLRNREGYMADWWQEADGTWVLVENHCPVCAAATLCQGFCRAEMQIFRTVLRADVERMDHILAGARRCAYRIKPRASPAEGA